MRLHLSWLPALPPPAHCSNVRSHPGVEFHCIYGMDSGGAEWGLTQPQLEDHIYVEELLPLFYRLEA